MNATLPSVVATAHTRSPVHSRKHLTVASLLAFLTLGLMAAFPSHALDLVAFVGIGGPLAAALGQLAITIPVARRDPGRDRTRARTRHRNRIARRCGERPRRRGEW